MKSLNMLLALSLVLLASCKKNYGCECSDTTSSIRVAIYDTKKGAKKKCQKMEYHENGSCILIE